MQSDKAQRAYLHFVMQKDNADQVKDPFNNTPPIDYERAVQLSIQQRYVDSEDHLIIKNLGVVIFLYNLPKYVVSYVHRAFYFLKLIDLEEKKYPVCFFFLILEIRI